MSQEYYNYIKKIKHRMSFEADLGYYKKRLASLWHFEFTTETHVSQEELAILAGIVKALEELETRIKENTDKFQEKVRQEAIAKVVK